MPQLIESHGPKTINGDCSESGSCETRDSLTRAFVGVGLTEFVGGTIVVVQTLDFETPDGFVERVAQISGRARARRRVVHRAAHRVVAARVFAHLRAFAVRAAQTRRTVVVFVAPVRFAATGLGVRVAHIAVRTRTLERAQRVHAFGARMARILRALVHVFTTGRRVFVTAVAPAGTRNTKLSKSSNTDVGLDE